MANANPIVAAVFRNLHHLLGDVDAVQVALHAVRAEMGENAARLAEAAPLLVEARRLAGQVRTMAVVPAEQQLRPACVVEFAEVARRLEAAIGVLLEQRGQLVQAVELLVVVRAIAAVRRRAHLVPSVVLAAAALARAASVYGVEPGFMGIFVIVSTLLLFFLSMF
ncbi:hypothetical protein ABZP36_016901 [Zizania latifolia]